MRISFIALVLCICATFAFTSEANEELVNPLFADEAVEIVVDQDAPANFAAVPFFLLSWQVRRMIRRMQLQMPCGWPQYGIPPLAPFRREETNIRVSKPSVETSDQLFRLKVDGLDNFKIQSFKLNMIKKKVTFDFLFYNVEINAQQYETDTVVDLLSELGISVQYEGSGALKFNLINLRLAGTLHYKLPLLWGSAKILSLDTQISLGSCQSQIDGIAGNGSLNRLLNSQIEHLFETTLNDYPNLVSQKIENAIIPPANKWLKGKDFWTLIDFIFSSSDEEGSSEEPIDADCVAQPDPWA